MTDAWTGYISIHTNITNRLSICWISALFRIHTNVCPCFCETSHCCVIITVIRGVMSFILFLVLLIRDNCEEYIPFGVLILNLRFAKLLTRSNRRRTVSVREKTFGYLICWWLMWRVTLLFIFTRLLRCVCGTGAGCRVTNGLTGWWEICASATGGICGSRSFSPWWFEPPVMLQ